MIYDIETDSFVKQLAEDPLVRVAFVVSSHGKVELCHPREKEKQVGQWGMILKPYLKLFSKQKNFRFSRLQYREGDLWLGQLNNSDFLILLAKRPENPESFYKNIIFNIQNFIGVNRTSDETHLDLPVQNLLYHASDHLKNHTRSEDGFFGALRKIAFLYFGELGEEWVDQGLENLWVTLPIRQRQPMEEMIAEVVKRISHPIKRTAFKRDASDLIKKFLD